MSSNTPVSQLDGFIACRENDILSPANLALVMPGLPKFMRHLADITNATSGGPLQPATDEQRVLHNHLTSHSERDTDARLSA